MLEATITLSPIERMRSAVFTLAMRSAREAVKRQLRAQGLKVSHYSAKDIAILAEPYLEQHRAELLAEAKRTVERWVAEGFFGKRAQRAWCANLASAAQRPGHCSSNEISVQNSSAEGRAE